MENKIKEKTKVIRQVYVNCNLCNKEIVGSTREQVLYNLDTHIRAKHKENKQ